MRARSVMSYLSLYSEKLACSFPHKNFLILFWGHRSKQNPSPGLSDPTVWSGRQTQINGLKHKASYDDSYNRAWWDDIAKRDIYFDGDGGHRSLTEWMGFEQELGRKTEINTWILWYLGVLELQRPQRAPGPTKTTSRGPGHVFNQNLAG